MELVGFLLARIAEDEAAAHRVSETGEDDEVSVWDEPYGELAGRAAHPLFAHARRFDPARILRECEAKRQVVEACGPFTDRDHWTDSPPSQAVRYLAVVYADHPDYRQEWKP